MGKWWSTLQPREKKVLGFGSVAFVVMMGYLFVVEPLMEKREQLTTRVAAQKNLKAHMERVVLEAKSLRAKTGGAKQLSGTGNETLLAVVSKTSRQNGIKESMKRITPEGNKKASIWFEDAPFDQMISWITSVSSSYAIVVDNINITAEDAPGHVRAKLTLVTAK